MVGRLNNVTFKLIRVSTGLTQREFADTIGYSFALISHIETGLKPVSKKVSDTVAAICNLDAADFAALEVVARIGQGND